MSPWGRSAPRFLKWGEAQRLLNGYIDYLKREKPGKAEPGMDINIERSDMTLDEDTVSYPHP